MNITRHPIMAVFTGSIYAAAFIIADSVDWAWLLLGFGMGMYAVWLFTKSPGPV